MPGAEKHCREAERREVHAVSVRRDSPDPGLSYSFTLEKSRYDRLLSFRAALDCAGGPAEAEGVQLSPHDGDKILRIVWEQQLVAKVKEYETPGNGEASSCDETTYQTAFRFADGNTLCAPIDAGAELAGAFYSLAESYCPLG